MEIGSENLYRHRSELGFHISRDAMSFGASVGSFLILDGVVNLVVLTSSMPDRADMYGRSLEMIVKV